NLKKWWRKSAALRAPTAESLRVHPRLESLEVREVPNASTTFDGLGRPIMFVTRVDGSMARFEYDGRVTNYFNGSPTHKCNSAHAYKDPGQRIGFDVTFESVSFGGRMFYNKWIHYSPTGSIDMGDGYWSISRTYGPTGTMIIDAVTQNYTGGGVPGLAAQN